MGFTIIIYNEQPASWIPLQCEQMLLPEHRRIIHLEAEIINFSRISPSKLLHYPLVIPRAAPQARMLQHTRCQCPSHGIALVCVLLDQLVHEAHALFF